VKRPQNRGFANFRETRHWRVHRGVATEKVDLVRRSCAADLRVYVGGHGVWGEEEGARLGAGAASAR
jgi:hypothetical protein